MSEQNESKKMLLEDSLRALDVGIRLSQLATELLPKPSGVRPLKPSLLPKKGSK